MESLSSIELHYNVNFANANSSLTLLFSELFDTNFGQLAYTRVAMGWRWYPFGLNGQRKIVDNEVEGRFWNSKPFLEFTGGLSNISIATDDIQNIDFNAVIIDFAPTLGLEVPIGTNFLLMSLIRYVTSINSLTATADDPLSAVSYSGFQILLGFRVTPF
ncbi:MAG: hypothetical protein IT285_12260 [Bdellovibrionales bacterium]|nr:hypothetical protein [Bdellovibrionales bacterium]